MWRGGVGVAEQLRAACQQPLGLALREPLALEVGLLGVAHVGERHLGAGLGEDAAERDRVVLVGGSVVGNDDLGGHCGSPVLGRRPVAGREVHVGCLLRAHRGTLLLISSNDLIYI